MIADYAESLARPLAFDPELSRRVRDEVEDHLRDAAAAGGPEAERAAIERFGDARQIAAQIASTAITGQARQAGLGVILVIACLFLAMKMRLAWYEFTDWAVCEASMPLSDALATLDRSMFLLAAAAAAAAWATRERQRLFRVLCFVAATAVVGAVFCDGFLTLLRLSGWEFSTDFLVPLASMAVECAGAGALLLQLYALDRRSTLAGAAFPELR